MGGAVVCRAKAKKDSGQGTKDTFKSYFKIDHLVITDLPDGGAAAPCCCPACLSRLPFLPVLTSLLVPVSTPFLPVCLSLLPSCLSLLPFCLSLLPFLPVSTPFLPVSTRRFPFPLWTLVHHYLVVIIVII